MIPLHRHFRHSPRWHRHGGRVGDGFRHEARRPVNCKSGDAPELYPAEFLRRSGILVHVPMLILTLT